MNHGAILTFTLTFKSTTDLTPFPLSACSNETRLQLIDISRDEQVFSELVHSNFSVRLAHKTHTHTQSL